MTASKSQPIPEWTLGAACAQVGSDFWFPKAGSAGTEAKKVCADCPVRGACLEWSLENGERYGIWGGLTWGDRKKLGPKRRCLNCDQPFAPASPSERMCSEHCRSTSRSRTLENKESAYRCIQCGAPTTSLRCGGCFHRYQVDQVMTRSQTKAAA